MDHLLVPLIAAIESGFARSDEWREWADRRILELPQPPIWILNLALATDADEASDVLRVAQNELWISLGCDAIQQPESIDRLHIGFLFLRFERGDFDILALLLKAGASADSASDVGIECEAFYVLANEIDGGGPVRPAPSTVEDRVFKLFQPLSEAARGAWAAVTAAAVHAGDA